MVYDLICDSIVAWICTLLVYYDPVVHQTFDVLLDTIIKSLIQLSDYSVRTWLDFFSNWLITENMFDCGYL
jgi:hypothetical protein